MRIIIEKTDDGQFMVGQEGALQPAATIEEAFQLAARAFAAPVEGEVNPFDAGMAKTAPRGLDAGMR